MQVGSLGGDEENLMAIGETSEGMAVDTHVEKAQADAAAAAVPDEAARIAEGVAAARRGGTVANTRSEEATEGECK